MVISGHKSFSILYCVSRPVYSPVHYSDVIMYHNLIVT